MSMVSINPLGLNDPLKLIFLIKLLIFMLLNVWPYYYFRPHDSIYRTHLYRIWLHIAMLILQSPVVTLWDSYIIIIWSQLHPTKAYITLDYTLKCESLQMKELSNIATKVTLIRFNYLKVIDKKYRLKCRLK